MPELPNTPDRSALPPVAFVSTLHDPTGRLLGAVRERGAALADYDAVYVTVTDATHRGLAEELMARAVHVIGGKNDQVGTARRRALQGAFDDGHGAVLYCDFDRWLHWVGCAPAELAGLPQRLLGRRRPLWYACLGRSKRAFATHPYVQRVAEGATNRAISLALGRRLDATAGACWVSGEGAAIILAHSQEATNATDLEWPALIHRADRRRLGYVATEGLEFETAEFFGPEVAAAGGVAPWQRAHYERPEVWQARLRLAADSARALCDVLAPAAPGGGG